ncbi:tetratricopeptide repeat protein [Ruegeria lacuscaerulensis]|uniref:hypothetical protein n=1 Tax=Ruegeria lacuscaerulensis TaxID=55218 RepID=UPI00147F4550|nr:hypothetical protein [Ruegeria lacuscaerulensis]
MIRLGLFLAVLLAANGATAREATVRSGEHEDYTRLVIQVPPGTGWVLTQTKYGARLNVTLEDVHFETTSVFRRLSQNRLSAISQAEPGGPLEMQFGCECAASAFLYQDTMIVVDIAIAQALPPIGADIPPPILPQANRDTGLLAAAQNRNVLPMPALPTPLLGFEDRLSERLLQGADRGIVDLELAQVGPRSSIFDGATEGPADPTGNISVSTVLDELNGLLGPDLIGFEQEPACISDTELGFGTWGGSADFPQQIATLRSGLFQEFDRVNQDTALSLAKLYAFYGFGAEAMQALALVEDPDADVNRVAAIAQYLDAGHVADDNPFGGLQRCGGDVALWAVLMAGELSAEANLDRVEQSFSRLPTHLRRQFGPDLSEILVDAGRLEATRRVLRSVDRAGIQNASDTTRAKAKVAAAEGDAPKAEALLNDVVASSGPNLDAPLALARLIENRWVDRGAASPEEVALAASFSNEFRKSEIEPQLKRAHAVALSLTQEFDLAFDAALEIPAEQERLATLNRISHILVERADDITFLRRALEFASGDTQDLSTDTAVALANRLVKLGFPGPALALSNRPQDTVQRSERARIRARSALQTQRPHQAMLELEGDSSEEALRIRHQAMQALGDFDTAGELSRTLGQAEQADRNFWLADRPEAIDQEEETQFGLVSKATQVLITPPVSQPDKPLAEAADLLQDSVEAREKITELLTILEQ